MALVKEEFDLKLFPVVTDVNVMFVGAAHRSKIKLVLPCDRVVWLDHCWKDFSFPFEGCHDFCPFKRFGYDKMYDCEIFKAEYERLLSRS